jgi:hypothetical protein
MMKIPGRTQLAALVCTVLLVAGCSDGGSAEARSAPDPSSSQPTDSSSPTEVTTTPVDGTWALKQTRADVVEHLEQHGFGRLIDRFLRAERVWAQDNWEWEFQDGFFTARWMQLDRAWKVADYGTYEVQNDKLDLQFGETATTTTFTWTKRDDELTLDWVDVDSDPNYKGIPDEAFWRAYLSEPLVRVD